MSWEVNKLLWIPASPTSLLSAVSLEVSGPQSFPFGIHGPKAKALVTPFSCAPSQILSYPGQIRDRTQWGRKAAPPPWWPTAPLRGWRFTSFGVLAPVCSCYNSSRSFWSVVWGLECERMERKREKYRKGVSSMNLNISCSFSCSRSQNLRDLLEGSSCPFSGFRRHCRPRLLEGHLGRKWVGGTLNSGFHPQPACYFLLSKEIRGLLHAL